MRNLNSYLIIINIDNFFINLYSTTIEFLNKNIKGPIHYPLSSLLENFVKDPSLYNNFIRELDYFIDWSINKLICQMYSIEIINFNTDDETSGFLLESIMIENPDIYYKLQQIMLCNYNVRFDPGEQIKTLVSGKELLIVRKMRIKI